VLVHTETTQISAVASVQEIFLSMKRVTDSATGARVTRTPVKPIARANSAAVEAGSSIAETR
jgi:hypothetical protein